VAEEFELHPLAVEDAISAHQRAKLERYDDVWFVVLHPARYVEAEDRVELGELHVFTGPDFVVTVSLTDAPDLARVRSRLEEDVELLRRGPLAILYAVLDHVVDRYAPVVQGMRDDVDEVEDQLFERRPEVSRRIYELAREAIALQRATHSMRDMLAALDEGPAAPRDVELRRNLRDVHDHTIRLADQADAFRALLDNALTVHATLVSQEQNEEMRRLSEVSLAQAEQAKKISSWAAILFAPTVVTGIYGMNFVNMPELRWHLGYAWALALMLTLGLGLYTVFKRRDWL
jgi:magnesium transporter